MLCHTTTCRNLWACGGTNYCGHNVSSLLVQEQAWAASALGIWAELLINASRLGSIQAWIRAWSDPVKRERFSHAPDTFFNIAYFTLQPGCWLQRQFLQERWVFSLFLECYCFPLLVREVCITVHHSFSCRSSSLKINHLSYSSQTWSYLNLLTFPYCSFRHWACQEESLGLISVGQFDAEEHKVRNWDLWCFRCLNLLCSRFPNMTLTNFSEEHIPQGRSHSSWKSVTVAQFNVGEKGLSLLLYCGLLSAVLT